MPAACAWTVGIAAETAFFRLFVVILLVLRDGLCEDSEPELAFGKILALGSAKEASPMNEGRLGARLAVGHVHQ
jgi:hypothetical protein